MTDAGIHAGPTSRRLRVLTTIAEVDGAAESWRALWSRCEGARTPFMSFEWVRTWAKHYAGDGRLYIIVVSDGDEVLGIMPLVRTHYRIGPFSRTVLETAGSESRNMVALMVPGAAPEVACDIATHLAAGPLVRGAALRLTLVPSETPFLSALADALGWSRPQAVWGRRTVSFAPYIPIPANFEDFELSLGRRRRKVLGRAQKKLNRLFRDVRIRTASGHDAPRALEELIRLHEARWLEAGIRGLFHDERNRAFHLDVVRECDRLGWLDLSEMLLDGAIVSSHFALVLDGITYLMRSGRDTSYAAYDVGHLHDYALFRGWTTAGGREVDFLRGAEPYKFYWTRNYRAYVELLAVRGGRFCSVSLRCTRMWVRVSRFLAHRHPPRELLAYVKSRRAEKRELRKMRITLRA
jgi:CelD/BcsL family acetyltransferase involved in cellulose biosynthesis